MIPLAMLLRLTWCALLGIGLLWISCSTDESSKKPGKKPTKSTTTGKPTGVDDDGLGCEDSEGMRMVWGFLADADSGKLDLALFSGGHYHFTATTYPGEAVTAPSDAKTVAVVGAGDPDAVLEFDLSDIDETADSTADYTRADGTNTHVGGIGGPALKEVTVIIKGKASKLLLCDAEDSAGSNPPGGIQSKSKSFDSNGDEITTDGKAVLLKVVMSPLCWGSGFVGDYKKLFKGCIGLKEVSGKIDTNITDLSSMFGDLDTDTLARTSPELERVDASAWDTSKVTNMQGMFEGATRLKEVIVYDDKGTQDESDDVGWDTSKVTNMQGMFKDIGDSPELSVIGFDKLDFSSLVVENPAATAGKGMVEMFSGTKLNLASFKGLLFGLLEESPSADPHLNAGQSTCDDSASTDAAGDDESCCKHAMYKIYDGNSPNKGWTNLIGYDVTNSKPYLTAAPSTTCTLP